jgi:hypothetical protein
MPRIIANGFVLSGKRKFRAFITDSKSNGPNGIIVVDLVNVKCWLRLNDHPSTKARCGFIPDVEEEILQIRQFNRRQKSSR